MVEYEFHRLSNYSDEWLLVALENPFERHSDFFTYPNLQVWRAKIGSDQWKRLCSMDQTFSRSCAAANRSPEPLFDALNLPLTKSSRRPSKYFRDRCMFRILCNADFSSMRYIVKQQGVSSISLVIHYVPYQHFQRSRGYRWGFNYTEYMKFMSEIRHRIHYDNSSIELKRRLCMRIKDYLGFPACVLWVFNSDVKSILLIHHMTLLILK